MPVASSVEGTLIVVRARTGKGGAGFIPGEGARVVSCGKAEGAGAFQFVLQAPVDERRLLGYFARLGVLVIVVVGQTDHGVSFRQVSAEGGAFGGLDRKIDKNIRWKRGTKTNSAVPLYKSDKPASSVWLVKNKT